MRKKSSRQQAKPDRVSVPLSMPRDLEEKVITASKRVNLSKQDTMRLGLERGLEVLIRQLCPEAGMQTASRSE